MVIIVNKLILTFRYFQENWFYLLEKEFEKVSGFYTEKKSEALRKFNTLKEQLREAFKKKNKKRYFLVLNTSGPLTKV